ncbi:MAG: hypothetical protein WA637_13320, partial [Terriglobales bacterium]
SSSRFEQCVYYWRQHLSHGQLGQPHFHFDGADASPSRSLARQDLPSIARGSKEPIFMSNHLQKLRDRVITLSDYAQEHELGSLEELTAQRYDDVDMNGDTRNTSMSINDSLIVQLLLLQQLASQSRFNFHSSPRPPQTPAASS